MAKTNAEYHERILRWLEDSYVAASQGGNVFGGSGFRGDMAHWEARRRVIVNAFDHGGTWIDIGCANGLLMQTLSAWALEKGVRLEPYGLELSARIADTARARLPRWADRIWTGNVMLFEPPIRFDYVTALPEYAPPDMCDELFARLAGHFLKSGGRLVINCYGPSGFVMSGPAPAEAAGDLLRAAGFKVAGEAEATDASSGMVRTRVGWADV